jgi:hypothetical protein
MGNQLRSEYYFKEECFIGFIKTNINILHIFSHKIPVKKAAQKTTGLCFQKSIITL